MKCLPAGPLPACRNHLLLACTECNQCAAWRLRDGKNGVSGTGSFGQIGLSETLGPYHMLPMQQSVLDGCSWEQWRRGPHLVQDLDGSSAMRREAAGSSSQCSGWLWQDSLPTSCLRAMATRSFLKMHRPSAFLISLQGVSEVCLRALRTRKPSSSTISSWWTRRARMRSSKRWQPIPQCSSCSVAAARFRDGLPSMSLRQELTIEPEDLRLELRTSAMSEASISRLRMHRFWRRAPRATRS